jgi:hypothetical protein
MGNASLASPRLLLTGPPHPPPATINSSASGQLCSARPSDAPLISRRNPAPATPLLRPRLASPPLRKVRSFHTPSMHTPPLLLLPLSLSAALGRTLGGPDRRAPDLRICVRRWRRDRAWISRFACDLVGSGGNGLPACRL